MEKVVNPGTEEDGFWLNHIKDPEGELGPEEKAVRKHSLSVLIRYLNTAVFMVDLTKGMKGKFSGNGGNHVVYWREEDVYISGSVTLPAHFTQSPR